MAYRVAICDDDRGQLEYLEAVVRDWSRAGAVRAFLSAEEFLFECQNGEDMDILLLDVEMAGISGIELARRLRARNSRTEIVFITSHFEFVAEGYEVDALHYLVKPVAREKLMEVLDRAADRLAVEPPSVIFTCEGETVRLYESEILYAESFLHYISVHTQNREYRVKESISAFEARLSGDFFRVHRSYIVSLKHIKRISRVSVTVGGRELPLARGKYDAVNRAFIERN